MVNAELSAHGAEQALLNLAGPYRGAPVTIEKRLMTTLATGLDEEDRDACFPG